MTISGPPSGIVAVGGYRFGLDTLGQLADAAEPGSSITARPDLLAGNRLAGTASEPGRVRKTISRQYGVNPLIARRLSTPVDADREGRSRRMSVPSR